MRQDNSGKINTSEAVWVFPRYFSPLLDKYERRWRWLWDAIMRTDCGGVRPGKGTGVDMAQAEPSPVSVQDTVRPEKDSLRRTSSFSET